MKQKLFLLGLLAMGCSTWHLLRPSTANHAQVGSLTLYVTRAEYSDTKGRVKMVVQLDNRTGQPQPFDPGWLVLQSQVGSTYVPFEMNPPARVIPPGAQMQIVYHWNHVPQMDAAGAMTLVIAGTPTIQFAGFY